MYYCFVKEDIEQMNNRDPFMLQKEYAKQIEKLWICDLGKEQIFGIYGDVIEVFGKKVLLRATYDNMSAGMNVLEKYSVDLVENENDVSYIEAWYHHGIAKRKIYETELGNVINVTYDNELFRFLENQERVFLKSRNKGFCARVSTKKLLQKESMLMKFLSEKSETCGETLLLSEFLNIKKDSLGSKESRHVVIEGRVINSSRKLHSLKHCVPKSHVRKAQEVVEYIKTIENFPQNYVLDIGEFVENENSYLDVVEVNPLSSSLCYVNNSIFEDELPEIEKIRKRMMMGMEYCLDGIGHPERYREIQQSNVNYAYENDEWYEFV